MRRAVSLSTATGTSKRSVIWIRTRSTDSFEKVSAPNRPEEARSAAPNQTQSTTALDLTELVLRPAALTEIVNVKRFNELLEHRELFFVDLGDLFGLGFAFGFFILEDQ